MARRILVHAGLHKTATTTAQKTLLDNAVALDPYIEIHLKYAVGPLAGRAKAFSLARNKATKRDFRDAARLYFASLDKDDTRPILFSNESLSGHFIGASGIKRYAATPILMELMKQAWHDVMGDQSAFEVYLSTRRNGWVEACYWQNVKRSRMTITLEEFSAKYPDAANHAKVVEQTKDRIGADAVHTAAMEDMPHPIVPILNAIGLAHLFETLTLPRDQNRRLPQSVYDDLLALNRSDLKWADMQRAKKSLLLAKDPDWEGLW